MAFVDLSRDDRNESISSRKLSISQVGSYLQTRKSRVSRTRHSSVICSSLSLFDDFDKHKIYTCKSIYQHPSSHNQGEENFMTGMEPKFLSRKSGCYEVTPNDRKSVKRSIKFSFSTPSKERNSVFENEGCSENESTSSTSFNPVADWERVLSSGPHTNDVNFGTHKKMWHQSLMNLRKHHVRPRKLSDGWFAVRRKHSQDENPQRKNRPTLPFQKWIGTKKGELSKIDDLETLLKDRARTREFRQFLELEYNDENLDFWLDVESYKKCNKKKRNMLARQILNKYIKVNSPREINLDSSVRHIIEEKVLSPDSTTFDLAQDIVFKMMEEDPFFRFSHQYQNVKV